MVVKFYSYFGQNIIYFIIRDLSKRGMIRNMNKKLLFKIMIIIILLILLGILIYIKFVKKPTQVAETEITPLEEITDEQERQTIISLYFTNTENYALMPEARVVDAKTLLDNPYKALLEMLIEGPKSDKLKSHIPEGTKVNGAELVGDMVKLDLSQEFLDNQSGDIEIASKSIYEIVDTLTELNEVNSVKILINGEENKKFNSFDLSLAEPFVRTD